MRASVNSSVSLDGKGRRSGNDKRDTSHHHKFLAAQNRRTEDEMIDTPSKKCNFAAIHSNLQRR